jgi:hypothetical protein
VKRKIREVIKEDKEEKDSLFNEIKFKSQAAMEYLMTYGWAILIVSLAVGVLYSLGILNPETLKPQVCSLSAPFYCSDQYLDTNGFLTLTIAQGSGSNIRINKIACVDKSLLNQNGLPSNPSYWSNVGVSIPSGFQRQINNIICYSNNGNPYRGKIGYVFSGAIVINATTSTNINILSLGDISAQVKVLNALTVTSTSIYSTITSTTSVTSTLTSTSTSTLTTSTSTSTSISMTSTSISSSTSTTSTSSSTTSTSTSTSTSTISTTIPPTALDGHCVGGGLTAPPVSCQLTTTNPNDMIIVLAAADGGSGTPTISDSAGLSWNLQYSQLTSKCNDFWVFYALPGRALSSDTITVSRSSAIYMSILAIGITNGKIFDPNTSLPACAVTDGSSASITISTSNPQDFIVAMASTCHVAIPGWGGVTGLDYSDSGFAADAYKITSTTLNGYTISVSMGGGTGVCAFAVSST